MTVDEAVKKASKDHGLDDQYADFVVPLLSMQKHEWPTCCNGGCEPCYGIVTQVADQALKLLNVEILAGA